MATKEKIKQGKHLTVTTLPDGSVNLQWDWDALIHEVRAATLAHESKQELKAEKIEKKVKKDLIKKTEEKVAKSRAKKVASTQITDAVTTKKPSSKKKSK